MSIIALAIGAASQLSLSQSLSEEVTRKEAFAINYAENAARLWQLGIPSSNVSDILLKCRNVDNTFMTLKIDSNLSTSSIDNPIPLVGGDDGLAPSYAISVERTAVRVEWLPLGAATPIPIDFPILRQIQPLR